METDTKIKNLMRKDIKNRLCRIIPLLSLLFAPVLASAQNVLISFGPKGEQPHAKLTYKSVDENGNEEEVKTEDLFADAANLPEYYNPVATKDYWGTRYYDTYDVIDANGIAPYASDGSAIKVKYWYGDNDEDSAEYTIKNPTTYYDEESGNEYFDVLSYDAENKTFIQQSGVYYYYIVNTQNYMHWRSLQFNNTYYFFPLKICFSNPEKIDDNTDIIHKNVPYYGEDPFKNIIMTDSAAINSNKETDADGVTYYSTIVPANSDYTYQDGDITIKVGNVTVKKQIQDIPSTDVNGKKYKVLKIYNDELKNETYETNVERKENTGDIVQYADFPTDGGLRVYLKYDGEFTPCINLLGHSRSEVAPNVGTPMTKIEIPGTHTGTYYYYDFGKYVDWEPFAMTDDAGQRLFYFTMRVPTAAMSSTVYKQAVNEWYQDALVDAAKRTTAVPHDLIYEYSDGDFTYKGYGPDKDYMTKTADELYDEPSTTYTLVSDKAIDGRTEIPMIPSRHRFAGPLDKTTWTVFLRSDQLPEEGINYYIKGSDGTEYRPSTDGYDVYTDGRSSDLIMVQDARPKSAPKEYGQLSNCKVNAGESTNLFSLKPNVDIYQSINKGISYTISLNASDVTSFGAHPYGPWSVAEDANDAMGYKDAWNDGVSLVGNILKDNPNVYTSWGKSDVYTALSNKTNQMSGNYDDGFSYTLQRSASTHFSDYLLAAARFDDRTNFKSSTSAKATVMGDETDNPLGSIVKRAGMEGGGDFTTSADYLIRPQVQDGHDATQLEGGIFIASSVDKSLRDGSGSDTGAGKAFGNVSQLLSLKGVDDNLYDECTIWLYPAQARYKIALHDAPYIVGPATDNGSEFPTMSANSYGRQVLNFEADDNNALDKQEGIVDATTKTINFNKIKPTTPASRKFVRNGDGVNNGDGDYYAYVDFKNGGASGLPFRFVMNKTYYRNYGEDANKTSAEEYTDKDAKDTQYKNWIYLNKQTTPTAVTTAMNSTVYNSTDDSYGAEGQNILWKLNAGKRLVRLHLGDGTSADPAWYTVTAALPMLNVKTIYSGSTGAQFGTVDENSRTIGDKTYNYVTSWASDLAYKLPEGYDEFYVTEVTTDKDKKQVVAKLKRVSDNIQYIPANTGVLLMTTTNYGNDDVRYHNQVLEVYDTDPNITYTETKNLLDAIVTSKTFAYDNGDGTYNYLFGYYAPQGTTTTKVPNKVYYLGFWRQKPGEATASSSNMARLIIGEDINPWWTEIGDLLQVDTEGAAKDMPYITFELDDSDPVADAIKDVPSTAPAHNSDAIYTLQGVRVEKPQQRGVYIMNGKKIVVR